MVRGDQCGFQRRLQWARAGPFPQQLCSLPPACVSSLGLLAGGFAGTGATVEGCSRGSVEAEKSKSRAPGLPFDGARTQYMQPRSVDFIYFCIVQLAFLTFFLPEFRVYAQDSLDESESTVRSWQQHAVEWGKVQHTIFASNTHCCIPRPNHALSFF
jgi:hypothetical protein